MAEVKKSSNPENDDWDLKKLAEFKKQLGYKIAMFFRFVTDGKSIGFECACSSIATRYGAHSDAGCRCFRLIQEPSP